MGWFSPVKGEYPGLAQVDKALLLADSVTSIERGMIVALGEGDNNTGDEGVWKLPEATDKLLYVALQDYTDPTAGFAGTAFDPSGNGKPRINALDLAMDAEYETSVFDLSKTYRVGDKLMAGTDGKLTLQAGDGYTVGYVTMVPKKRWINNAVAVKGNTGVADPRVAYRTGATETVLRFKTAV